MAEPHAAALEVLTDQVRAAAAAGRALYVVSGGTKDFYGNPVAGERLDPRGYAGVVAYEPAELVVVARCGTPLAQLEALLDGNGQMLAFEPPHFGAAATVGGCIAAGLAGPRRAANGCGGAVRDFVLGAKLLNGRAEVLAFGGTVMKNVAGYDVSRLLAGSLGTLGVVLEVALKVMPRPVAEETLCLEAEARRAAVQCRAWAREPWPLSATSWNAGRLHVRLSGARAAVDRAMGMFGGERLGTDAARGWWRALREHTHPFFARPGPLWRISVPATAPALGLGGEELIEWSGALRWLVSTDDPRRIRRIAAERGGHATLFRGNPGGVAAFAPLSPVVARIEARLRAEFDPAGIFNRGRMHADAAR